MNTSTAIEICSRALILLGHNPISSFDEAGAGATVANAMYESSLNSLLQSHRWNFTKKKASLNRLVAAPLNEYSYQYQLPTDYLNIIKVSDNSDYEIYQDKIYSDQTSLDIDYVFRPDETQFPPLFTETLEFYLASKFAIPVTDSKTNAEVYLGFYNQQIKKAKAVDAQSVPAYQLNNTEYLAIRE